MDSNPKPGSGWDDALRKPVKGKLEPTPPAVPVSSVPPPVPEKSAPPPRPRAQVQDDPTPRPRPAPRRSVLPLVMMLLIALGSAAAAVHFAMENEATQKKLEEANRNVASVRQDYEQTASTMVAEREAEWEKTKSRWAEKEKELTSRAAKAEQSATEERDRTRRDLEQARTARTAAESRANSLQSQLTNANAEVSRLRSQVKVDNRPPDEILRTNSTEIRDWMKGLLAPLPDLSTREEVRVALRKYEMGKIFDGEKKKLDRTIFLASGPLVMLDRGEMGLAFRGVALRYGSISSAMPANIVEASYAYHWSVPAAAASLEPDRDLDVSGDGIPAYSEDAAKELRFDYRKTDEKFRYLETMTPVDYRNSKNHLVLAIKFKERGDLRTPRLLLFRATSWERGK